MKLLISKNKDGNGYYSKIKNDYNGKHTEKYLTIQIPKNTELEYGLYEVDGFLSTYEKKDGTVELKLIITEYRKIEKQKEIPETEGTLEELDELSIRTEVQQHFNTDDVKLPWEE